MFQEQRIIFLERLGKNLGINLSYFLEHGFWITLRFFVIGGVGALLTIGFARLTNKEFFGAYQYVLSVLTLFSVFSLPGLNTVSLREVARGNCGVIRQAVRESFRWSLLVVPCIFGYGIFLTMTGKTELGLTFCIGSVLFPFLYAPNVWYVFYEGRSLFKPVSVRIIFATILMGVFVLLSIVFWQRLFVVISVYMGISAFFGWFFYAEFRKKLPVTVFPIDMRYGFSCTMQKFAYIVTDALPLILVASFLGYVSVATYQVACVFLGLVSGFTTALSATYMPLLFRYETLRHGRIMLLNLGIGLLFFLGYIFFLWLFFFSFFGEGYSESYTLAWILSPYVVVIPMRTFLINFFTSRNKNGLIVISVIATNVLSAMIFWWMREFDSIVSMAVYFYGVNMLSTLVLFVVHVFLEKRKRGINLEKREQGT